MSKPEDGLEGFLPKTKEEICL